MKKVGSIVAGFAGILLFVIGLYLTKTVEAPEGAMKVLPFICVGLGCGIFGQAFGSLLTNLIMRSNPEHARNMEIERKDERNQQLANRTKAKAYDAITYIFAALLIAFALMGVELEVIITLVVVYLLVHIYMIYYRLKLEKEA